MSGLGDAVESWREQPFPPGSSIDSLDELHADLALADSWVAESVIPFVEQGVYQPARLDVTGRLVDLREHAEGLAQVHDGPEKSLALAYRDYAALLIRVYQGCIQQSPRQD